MKMNFFYIKEFEIGYVLTLSSVKILTYKYCKTNKTLSFIDHQLYAHSFCFLQYIFYSHKKSFLFIEITLFKKTLKKNNITLYSCYC